VVIRGSGPVTEIALVHRPRYDDWTIPKGKDDPGESARQAALREVREETGLRCRIVGEAGTARYDVSAGPKQVTYFVMRPFRFAGYEPNEEVDEVRWVNLAAAAGLLTYEFDRRVLTGVDVAGATGHTSLEFIRHAAAGDRSRWKGRDDERPLTRKGRAQAAVIAAELADTGMTRIISSPYLRCVETVEPLAELLDLKVERHDALAEGASRKAIDALLDEAAGSSTVLCSHGDVIPAALDRFSRLGVEFLSSFACQKGSTWSIGHDGSAFTDALYLPPPVT
jgi:8-oxo-dGTP diphosphatase